MLNNTPVPVERVFASAAAARDWGHDRLAGAPCRPAPPAPSGSTRAPAA
ncbi:hypothetical protein [Teichococcus aestuarii]